jgi:hypothetical protein
LNKFVYDGSHRGGIIGSGDFSAIEVEIVLIEVAIRESNPIVLPDIRIEISDSSYTSTHA